MPATGLARGPIATSRFRVNLLSFPLKPIKDYHGLDTIVGGPTVISADLNASFSISSVFSNSKIQTRSTSIPINLTSLSNLSGIKSRTTNYVLTLTQALNSLKVIPVSLSQVLGFNSSLNPALVKTRNITQTLQFQLNIISSKVLTRTFIKNIQFNTNFPRNVTNSSVLSSLVKLDAVWEPEVAATISDPDDEMRIEALHDVRNHFYRSNVVEKIRALAAFESHEVIFPYSSEYLEFFIGFVSSDVPGVLYLDRKFEESEPWFNVRNWLVTNSVRFCEQIMSGFTRMRLVNSDTAQTRLVFKAEIYERNNKL